MLNPPVSDSRLPHPPPTVWTRRAVFDTVTGLVCSMRPNQWIKNLLVLLAPVAAGRLAAPGAAVELAVAFWAFSLTAGGVYLLNDVLDRRADERHPTKRHRPIASGRVGPTTASGASLALLTLPSLALAASGRTGLAVTMNAFALLNVGYTFVFKHHAFADVLGVATSLLLRALGGAVAVGISLHPLLAAVLFAAALHVISSKRFAELRDLGSRRGTRPVLARYSIPALNRVRGASAALAFGAYAIWVFDHAARSSGFWFVMSLVPVVVGFLRFEKVVAEGAGERPERLIVNDMTLRTSALCAVAALGLAAHVV